MLTSVDKSTYRPDQLARVRVWEEGERFDTEADGRSFFVDLVAFCIIGYSVFVSVSVLFVIGYGRWKLVPEDERAWNEASQAGVVGLRIRYGSSSEMED